jgi:hypothetical protein
VVQQLISRHRGGMSKDEINFSCQETVSILNYYLAAVEATAQLSFTMAPSTVAPESQQKQLLHCFSIG